MNRRLFASLLALPLLGMVPLAHALDIRPYDPAALQRLQTAGQPVAVHFHADWCSTCASQRRSLEQLKAGGQLPGMTVLVADYDQEKDLKRALKVRSQSVLVVFKGSTEVARSAGQTQPQALQDALSQAL